MLVVRLREYTNASICDAMDKRLKRGLQDAHKDFFERLNVDAKTGWVCGQYLKFASYPYVGSRYGDMKRLMVVGMDIGRDATPSAICTFETRQKIIEEAAVHKLKPHMAGTYVTAMHLLQGECEEWRGWLEASDDDRVPQALLNDTKRLPTLNPLSYIVFTNYYKFLLAHNGAKVQLRKEDEEQFLKTEAGIFEPAVIVLQGADFLGRKSLLADLSKDADVFVGYHPSVRGQKRRLGNFTRSIKQWPIG